MKTTDIGFERFEEDFIADPNTAFIPDTHKQHEAMDTTTSIMIRMGKLEEKFRKEVQNVDVLHPDLPCDTTFLKRYIKAYDYWVTYMMLPEEHCYKTFYACKLNELLWEIENDIEQKRQK